jgi:hypothetical protein
MQLSARDPAFNSPPRRAEQALLELSGILAQTLARRPPRRPARWFRVDAQKARAAGRHGSDARRRDTPSLSSNYKETTVCQTRCPPIVVIRRR